MNNQTYTELFDTLRQRTAELLTAREERDVALDALEQFKQRVRDRMIQEANDRGWCDEFDHILVEFGFEPRSKEYNVDFHVCLSYSASVTASSEDEAREQAWGTLRRNGVRDGYFCDVAEEPLTMCVDAVTFNEVSVTDS